MGVILVRNFLLMMVIVTLIMVNADSDSPEPNRQYRGSKWTVHVVNDMLPQDVLFLHCKSKDNDLGAHNITKDGEFSWTFRENLWVTTLFWCSFRSSYGYAEFEVFWPEKRHTWLGDHCDWRNCIWTAKVDGIYLLNIPIHTNDYKHDWIKTTL